MGALKSKVAVVARTPVARRSRQLFGRIGAPGMNPELDAVRQFGIDAQRSVDDVRRDVVEIERQLPAFMNAIMSTNGTARLLRRELADNQLVVDAQRSLINGQQGEISHLTAELEQMKVRIDQLTSETSMLSGHVRDQLWPLLARSEGLEGLYETAEWLTKRIELVRAELMHELRYPRIATGGEQPEVEIVNPDRLNTPDLRVNMGCGHIPLDGYVNVDMRGLPGVDVVAPVDAMPFEPGTVTEIFSSHVLEHFPAQQLTRQLLPYWFTLLSPGGSFRAVVPDIDAMIVQYRDGEISFDQLSAVVYGGQEYEGDFHHTAFTPETFESMLTNAGFADIEVLERGRVNGDCLEFEVAASRPI